MVFSVDAFGAANDALIDDDFPDIDDVPAATEPPQCEYHKPKYSPWFWLTINSATEVRQFPSFKH